MATTVGGGASAEKGTRPEKARDDAEVVSVELPAPTGWKKKVRFQGIPSCDTPRRSARIREKAKAVETPEDEKPKKRERKSSSKKGAKEKKDGGDAADETSEMMEDVTTEEAKVPTDVEMKEADDDVNKVKGEDVAVGLSADEGVTEEATVNKDPAIEVINEDAGQQDNSLLKTNGSVQEKTDTNLENNGEALPKKTEKNKGDNKPARDEVPPPDDQDGEILSEKSSHKEDAGATVMKEVPSATDGQHLPKASPVNC
ncbi:hypothetical protein BHM03_00004106 [Ensete ventricosum]|nr:hypothetical protein BHM03_00004106 [Ensete ventricosum]